MSWLFGPKEPKPEPKKDYQHWLVLHLVGGGELKWQFTRDKDHGPVHFWKGFMKWFFAKDTPYFVINVPHRRIVILRSQIQTFDLRVDEVKEGS